MSSFPGRASPLLAAEEACPVCSVERRARDGLLALGPGRLLLEGERGRDVRGDRQRDCQEARYVVAVVVKLVTFCLVLKKSLGL